MRYLLLVVLAASLLLVPQPLPTAHASADAPLEALDGVIQPFESIELGSPSSGVLSEVLAVRGQRVSQGEVLARLDATVETQSAQLAELAWLSRGDLEIARVKLDSAAEKLRTREALVEDGILSEEELKAAKAEHAMAQLEFAAAEEKIAIAGVEFEKAKAVLARTVIQAPVDAIVVERHRSVGEVINSSPEAVVFTLAQLDPLLVEVRAPVAWLTQLDVDRTATVIPSYDSSLELTATLEVIDQVADAASETVRLRFTLPNPDFALPAGVRCRVIL